MKYAILFLFLPICAMSQHTKYNWKKAAVVGGFGFVSGAAWGLHETSVHKPWNFPSTWNGQYWNASQSWTNKYKNGDVLQGPRFPLSTGALVMFTDAKHLTASIHKVGLLGAGITIGIGVRRPWWHYAADAVIGFAAYSTAFHMGYTYNMWKRN